MKDRQILVWFMRAKQERLKELGIDIPYFTVDDEDAIFSWTDMDFVLPKILKNSEIYVLF